MNSNENSNESQHLSNSNVTQNAATIISNKSGDITELTQITGFIGSRFKMINLTTMQDLKYRF